MADQRPASARDGRTLEKLDLKDVDSNSRSDSASGSAIQTSSTATTDQIWPKPNTLSPETDAVAHQSAQPSDVWKPGIFKFRPLLGLAELGVAVVCLFASLAILVASRGSPTRDWTLQPTVYLAIATAISNTALQCALSQAAPISWWYKALKGSTIRNLEIEWEAGQSFLRALYKSLIRNQGGRFISLLTIANIATAVVLIDGPLLQRSSSVQLTTITNNITLDVPLSPELPTGFSGTEFPTAFTLQASYAVEDILYGVIRGQPIKTSTECSGTCQTTVQGPGLTIRNCTTKDWPVTYDKLESANSTWGDNDHSKPFLYSQVYPAFEAEVEVIMVEVGMLNYRNCSGQYVLTTCAYIPAVVEYDITIQDHEITFTDPPTSSRVVAVANNTSKYNPKASAVPLTFSAFALIEGPSLEMNATLYTAGTGLLAAPDYPTLNALVQKFWEGGAPSICTFVTEDPTDYIVSQLNTMMFRGGILSAGWHNTTGMIDTGLSVNQTVATKQSQQENVFRSDLRWFAGAAAIQVLTILILLPVFWGWWEIGGDLSLSPFNTAKMMDASLLREAPSGTNVNRILGDLGSVRVKLGEVHAPATERSAARGEKGDVGSRIGLGRVDSVTTIRRRYSFHSL